MVRHGRAPERSRLLTREATVLSYAEWRKASFRVHRLFDSIYVVLQKWQNRMHEKWTVGCQESGMVVGVGWMEGLTLKRQQEGDFMVRDKSVSWWWCSEGHVWRSRKQWPQPLEQQRGYRKTVEQCLHNSEGNWFPTHISIPKPTGNQLYGWNTFSEIQHKEGWPPKTDALNCGAREDSLSLFFFFLEKTLESPLDCKEIKPVHPKGNQPWMFIRRSEAEAEAPILLATWCKEMTHWKRPWCWERWRAGREGDGRGWDGWMAWWTWFEQAPGDGEGQGSLACCSSWSLKESDTEQQIIVY